MASGQIMMSALDWLITGMVLFLLLPERIEPSHSRVIYCLVPLGAAMALLAFGGLRQRAHLPRARAMRA